MNFSRTTSANPDFQHLVSLLDEFLRIVDGDDHSFYAQFNKIVNLTNVIVCYSEGKAVGCGAFREYDQNTVEIKRMYVLPQYRGRGVGHGILKELELWAHESGYPSYILETGNKQQEAIALYKKSGYTIIPNYGQYQSVENSVCMKKNVMDV